MATPRPSRSQAVFWLVALWCIAGASLAQAQTDPPGRVARLGYMEGTAYLALEGSGTWVPAELNRPLTTGDQVAVDEHSRAELHSGSMVLRLDGRTRLSLSTLDDDTTRIHLAEGTLALRIRALYPGERVEINTANLAFVASQPGEYRFDVDSSRGHTRLTLHSGGGVIYGENGQSNSQFAPRQSVFVGRQLGLVQDVAVAPRDSFDQWTRARDQAEDQSTSARYISRDILGYHQLDAYGSWSHDPQHGAIWFPQVTAADWAPYRHGHWQWIAPWGWTWIDDAPWGFAPFHYGRWLQINHRWSWVPGPRTARPTYAPALVGFIGMSGHTGGAQWRLALGNGGPGVAWFPLAPGEAWQPGYRASPRYLEQVNRPHQHHGDRSDRAITPNNDYRYRHHAPALTAVPADDFGQRRSGRGGNPQRVAEAALARAQVLPLPPRSVQPEDAGRHLIPAAPLAPAQPRFDMTPSPARTAENAAPGRDFDRPRRPPPPMPGQPQPQPQHQPQIQVQVLPQIQPAWPQTPPPPATRPAPDRGTDRGMEDPRFQQPPPRRVIIPTPQVTPQHPQQQQQHQSPPQQVLPQPPHIQRIEPPVNRLEPPVRRMESPVQRLEPPVHRLEPRVQHAEPPAPPQRQAAPPQQRFEMRQEPAHRGQAQPHEAPRQRVEPNARPERGERGERRPHEADGRR